MAEKLGEIEGLKRDRISENIWTFDHDDWLLYAMLCDPIYCAELLLDDPNNREYHGTYRVRDYQYPLNRPNNPDKRFRGHATSRASGKTEAIKNKAMVHAFKRIGEDMLLTAPHLIHLDPLARAIEERYTSVRLLRDFLDTRNQRTGFTHRPFGVQLQDGTAIDGRLPRESGVGVKGAHCVDIVIDECFPAGTLVLTDGGQVPIEDVAAGDRVLTHRNRWRTVTATKVRRRKTVVVRGRGHPGLECSEQHPFLAVERTWGRAPCEPRFVPARELAGGVRTRYHWASPTHFPVGGTLPDWDPGLALVNDDFWWLLGLYMAEGSVSRELRQVTFSVHGDEASMVQGRLASIGYESSVTTREGDKGVRVMPREAGRLAHWLAENVGRIAAEHEVKPWLLGMGERERRLVLDGYVTGDGNYLNGSDSNLWQATSADRRLAISIKLLAQSLGQSVGLWHYDASSRKPSTIRGRTVRATGWYQLRGAAPGTTPLAPDSGHTYGCVREVRRTDIVRTLYDLTVECDESFVADGIVVHNSQDYPAPGWNEIQEALEHDHVDKDGNPDFNYEFYGVHSGARDTGFYSRATKGDFDMVHITALQRPDWGPQRKANAKAAYGGTSSPDYQRNILGRAGAAASPYFVLSRLLACVDQNRTSEYNEKEYVHQLLRAEDVDEVGLPIAEQLDLLGGKQVVYGGADIGLTISPTVISLFSLEMVKMDGERKARQRLKLFRRYTLERFRAKTIREVFYAIGFHHGNALQGFGIDATGLGRPIFQDMEDDEVAPQHLMDVARGYVFNVKVPVAVDKDHVSVDQGGRMRDQFGSQVKEEVDPLTGTTRLVTYMPMIEASTRYLADDIDSGLPLFPFDTEITADLQGETQQRVRVVGELKRKPNAMHILDSFRAMEMVYHSAQIEEQMAYEQAGPVLDRAI